MANVYKFEIDWNNNSSFSTDEDVTGNVWAQDPVVVDRGVDTDQLLAPVMAGEATLTLINSPSTTYHPAANTNVLPGRDLKITVISTGGSTFGVFRGNLDDLIVNDPTQPYLEISALDGLGRMFIKEISTQVYTNVATGTAIGYVLDAVGWPAGRRSLNTGATVMDYWWEEGTTAIQALQKLVDSEGPGARLFVNRDGDITFHDRHRRFTNTLETTSQATFGNQGNTEPVYSNPLSYLPRWRDILNDITLTVNTYEAQSTGEVWSYPFGSISLSPSEARSFKATGFVAFQNASTPSTAGSDYTVSAGGVSSVSLDRTSGQSATITITATTSGATIDSLRLRANAILQSDTVEVNVTSTGSQDKYGNRSFTRSAPWMPEQVARDVAQEMVNIQAEPNPQVEMRVTNLNATRRGQQLNREIGDRITIADDTVGLSTQFTIERKRDVVMDGGRTVDSFFTARRISTAALSSTEVFILDSTSNGILNVNKLGF